MKPKYVSCKLTITQFYAERGFAQSPVSNAMNWINGSSSWEQQKSDDGHYKNEGYLDQTFTWADNNSHLPGTNK